MRVLFLMFAFPDMNESFNMYTAMVDMFHKNGHSVTVIAPGVGIKRSCLNIEKGIEILRVKTLPIKNVSNIRKGIGNLMIPYQYRYGLNKFYKNESFDLIILPTPPITLGRLAEKLKKKHNSKVYLILRDIFPQNAVDLGFMKKGSIIHQLFERKEARLYATADKIGCMSQGNINFIKQNFSVKEEKLHVLKNWQYTNSYTNTNLRSIQKKYNLEDKFAVIFGGNMGKPQQLENVIQLANNCKNKKDIVFILLGEGVMMERIRQEVKQKKIENIHIYGSIPKLDYQNLLKVADVGLISLHEDFTIPNIPSKALDYWNVGIPILASLDRSTDFGEILTESQTGLWSYAGEHKELYESLIRLYENRELRETLSANGRLYFKNNLTPEIAYKTVIDNIEL